MDIVAQAKNIGAVLGTASIVAYAFGYLTLRARAFALGTDPAFKLVDEVYVFAGFRGLFITLIVLLLVSPVVLLIRWGAMWLARSISPEFLQPSQWLLLAAVAIMSVMTLSKILSVGGLLLQEGPLPDSGLQGAILGGAGTLRLLLIFAIVLLTALTALWLQASPGNETGPFKWVLAMVVGLQLITLPIYHGTLFADRRVRVLAASPDTVKGMAGPLGIVDRTAEHATLLGLNDTGARRLATVKVEDLNGIPIRSVISLEVFVHDVLGTYAGAVPAVDIAPNPGPRLVDVSTLAQGEQGMATNEREVEKGFIASLLESLRITLDAIGSLGESDTHSGVLWVVDLDAAGRPSGRRQVGHLDDLSWPVAGPDRSDFYALRRGRVVRLDAAGELLDVAGDGTVWRKLLGVTEDGTVLGLVSHQGVTRTAMLPLGGKLQVGSGPLSEEHKDAVARLQQEARSHVGGMTLIVERSERGGRGFDVFLRTESGRFNISDCADDSCGQASLSPNFRHALFIRQPRF